VENFISNAALFFLSALVGARRKQKLMVIVYWCMAGVPIDVNHNFNVDLVWEEHQL
jgi:hypothetical protein